MKRTKKNTNDSGIPVLQSWERNTINQKQGLTLWEKLGLEEMATQKPLPFDWRQMPKK